MKKMLTNKDKIHIFIREFHMGKDNPVSNKELQRIFRIREDEIRTCIKILRLDGKPVCYNESGYFYAQNREEILETVDHLQKMITGIEQSEVALLSVSLE